MDRIGGQPIETNGSPDEHEFHRCESPLTISLKTQNQHFLDHIRDAALSGALLKFIHMLLRSFPRLLTSLFLLALAARGSAAVVLELDAAALPVGEISEPRNPIPEMRWQPCAPLRVERVAERQAFVFDGTQTLISGLLPGEKWSAFTVEAWVRNPEIARIETVAAFCSVKGGSGTEFNFASSASAGAFRSGFKATTPFRTLPAAGAWHHLAWSYGAGVLRVFVDGELDAEQPLKVTLPMPMKVHVGASGEVDNNGPKKAFSGAVAKVKIHNAALTQEEVRASAGLLAPYAPEPRDGARTDALSVTLRWNRGVAGTTGETVFFGTDRGAVERGEKSASGTSNPRALRLGTTYFWRVETERHSSPVWTFTADAGLAAEPQPRDATSSSPAATTRLAWRPGKYATAQRVFFSASREDMKLAAELNATAVACAPPFSLAPGTRYFWRVESDNGAQPKSPGAMWSFRTQDAPVRNDVTFFTGSDTHYGRENNAVINRRVIDAMNALPGELLPASAGGGFVRTPRGVVLNGDLLDEGFDKETAPANWAEFCRDYGLTGGDGRLCFPLYEGFGNHDGGPVKSFVRAGIRERNPKRTGLTAISSSGLHYSWDWEHVHLVQLNLFGGAGPLDVKGVNGPEHDPEGALDFLRDDLAKHVGTSGRPVIVFQHFAWVGGMADWWQLEAKERFYDVVKPYRVACLINGHSHGASFAPWHDLLTVHDGSTARGEGDTGDFMVVRVTENELILAQQKLDGTWGIQMRRALNGAPTISK